MPCSYDTMYVKHSGLERISVQETPMSGKIYIYNIKKEAQTVTDEYKL